MTRFTPEHPFTNVKLINYLYLRPSPSWITPLKGITGNLAITPLFNGYTESLGLLRDNRAKEAKAVFARILPVQKDIIACINQNRNA